MIKLNRLGRKKKSSIHIFEQLFKNELLFTLAIISHYVNFMPRRLLRH